jgi:predicted acyltransferase
LFFLIAALLYVLVLIQIRPSEKPLDLVVIGAIAFLCLIIIGVAIFLRSRMVAETAAKLSTNPQDTELLNRWRMGVITSFTFAETIVLFGFLLKILGARWNVAGAFLVTGILLLAAWRPKLEVSTAN